MGFYQTNMNWSLLLSWIHAGLNSSGNDHAADPPIEDEYNDNQEHDVKRTMSLLLTIKPFFEREFGAELSGSQIIREIHGQSGVIYPTLHRLLEAGWLECSEEKIDPAVEKRPRRKLFRLTERGARNGHKLLSEYLPDPHKYMRVPEREKLAYPSG